MVGAPPTDAMKAIAQKVMGKGSVQFLAGFEDEQVCAAYSAAPQMIFPVWPRAFLLAETETAATILERGLLGFVFIGLELMVIATGLRKSWSIVKLSSSTLPLLLWMTTSLALLFWSTIGKLTVNVLGYLLLSLSISSIRSDIYKFKTWK